MIWQKFFNRIFLMAINQYLSKTSNVEFNELILKKLTMYGNIVPDVDLTRQVGTAGFRFDNIYSNKGNFSDTVTYNKATGGDVISATASTSGDASIRMACVGVVNAARIKAVLDSVSIPGTDQTAIQLLTAGLVRFMLEADGSITLGSVIKTGSLDIYLRNIFATGDITYSLRHAFISYSPDYTPSVVVGVYTKITPTFVTEESSNVTVINDNFRIVTAGDYILHLSFDIRANPNLDFRLEVRKAGVSQKGVKQTTSGTANYDSVNLIAYIKGCIAGDDIEFYITNLTNSDDPTLSDISAYIRKEH